MAIRDPDRLENLKRLTRSAVDVFGVDYGSVALAEAPLIAAMFEAGLEVRP